MKLFLTNETLKSELKYSQSWLTCKEHDANAQES